MKEVSQKLTLAQISKDMHHMSVQFEEHLKMGADFHRELKESMVRIENKLDPESEEHILKEANEKLDILMGLYDGVSFSGKAIKYTAGIVAALAILVGSFFSLIRFIK